MDRTANLPVILLVLAAITIAVYSGVGGANFLTWDDNLHVYHNPHLMARTGAGLRYFWGHPYEGMYIPVSYSAFGLLISLAQVPNRPADPTSDLHIPLDPHVFHWANLLIHVVNVLLVFALLRILVRHDMGAAAGALLFAVHPVQVESVAWISELRGLLAGLFSLLALMGFLRALCPPEREAGRPSRPLLWPGLATLAFVLALLCKPSAAVVPLLAACLCWWLVKDRASSERVPWALRFLGGWVALSCVSLIIAHIVQPPPPAALVSWWQRPLVACDAIVFYLGKLVYPYPLGIDYGRTPASVVSRPMVWGEFAFVIALGAALWGLRRRIPILPTAGALFVTALLPVLGFVSFEFQVYSTVTDRYLYLALLGPALAFAWLWRQYDNALVQRGSGAVLAALAFLAFAQCSTWQDDLSLFKQTVAVNPRSGMGYLNLGVTDKDLGRFQDAETTYRRAMQVSLPQPEHVYYDLGELYAQQGRDAEALQNYQEAARLNPQMNALSLRMGNLYNRLGNVGQAITEWQAAVREDPNNPEPKMSLGMAYAHLGRWEDASAAFLAMARLNPNSPDAAVPLLLGGNALVEQGRPTEAAAAYQGAIRLKPSFAEPHYRLGQLLSQQGKMIAARGQLEDADRLHPGDLRVAQALATLGERPASRHP